jgi:hypothetical protein
MARTLDDAGRPNRLGRQFGELSLLQFADAAREGQADHAHFFERLAIEARQVDDEFADLFQIARGVALGTARERDVDGIVVDPRAGSIRRRILRDRSRRRS